MSSFELFRGQGKGCVGRVKGRSSLTPRDGANAPTTLRTDRPTGSSVPTQTGESSLETILFGILSETSIFNMNNFRTSFNQKDAAIYKSTKGCGEIQRNQGMRRATMNQGKQCTTHESSGVAHDKLINGCGDLQLNQGVRRTTNESRGAANYK